MMAEHFAGERLEAVLISVGEHLLTETTDAVSPVVASKPRRPHLLAAAAAIILAIMAVTIAVPPARAAVARWFGIGSTRVEIVPAGDTDEADLSSLVDGLTPVSVDDAAVAIGRSLPDTVTTELGPPEAVLAMPEGGVILVWSEGATTFWVHPIEADDGLVYAKLISAGQEIRPIEDLGDEALLIVGDHLLVTPHRKLSAGTVLLWIEGGIEYRLESDLAQDLIVETARALR